MMGRTKTAAAKAAKTVEGAEVIASALRLDLRANDVLVFRTQELIRPEFRVYLQKQLRGLFPGNEVLVIDGPIDIFILSDGDPEVSG